MYVWFAVAVQSDGNIVGHAIQAHFMYWNAFLYKEVVIKLFDYVLVHNRYQLMMHEMLVH